MTSTLKFGVVGTRTGREAWEIVSAPDGAMNILSMSTDNGWAGQGMGFFNGVGDTIGITANAEPNPSRPYRWQFYFQPTSESSDDTFYIVNRHYCAALGFGGQSQKAVASASRSTAQKMKITTITQPTASWPYTQFDRSVLSKAAEQMFDRCNWVVAYQDTHSKTFPVYSVINTSKYPSSRFCFVN